MHYSQHDQQLFDQASSDDGLTHIEIAQKYGVTAQMIAQSTSCAVSVENFSEKLQNEVFPEAHLLPITADRLAITMLSALRVHDLVELGIVDNMMDVVEEYKLID